MSNANIERCTTFAQTVIYGGNIIEDYVEVSINIYVNQKLKVPSRYLLILTVLPSLLLELIASATIGFTTLKKLYHQYSFKIMDDSLIVNLIL